jgi:protein-L-isoaspartate(D-aspartate) O-methyltransferase
MDDEHKHLTERERMIQQQLIPRGIEDPRVLDAMRKVPRHRFLPRRVQEAAYRDGALPIGNQQTISQPYIVALMTQMLQLTGDERVLEIGTGSGYQTAILAELAASVVSIERYPLLAGRAGDLLAKLGYNNVEIYIGDGTQGMADMAPYDAIIVTAAAPSLPEPLRMQMNPEGGRMVLPIGSRGEQYLERVTRDGEGWHLQRMIPVRFVPLVGRYGFAPKDDDNKEDKPGTAASA